MKATCKQCGNKFGKGEGAYLAPSGGFSHSKSTEGYCNHCLDAHPNDVDYPRFGVPKNQLQRNDNTHNGLMRHFGKVPDPEIEPDFRQTTVKSKEKKPETPQSYNDEKHCAFCSGEFKKGEKTKKHLGEYPVHERCPSFPTFKQYVSAGKKHA